ATEADVPAGLTSPGAERRRRPRRPARGGSWVACRKGGAGPDVALSLIDVSGSGVRLLASIRLEAGEKVALALHARGEPSPVKRWAPVRWCVRTNDWSYCAGVELDQQLSGSEVEVLT